MKTSFCTLVGLATALAVSTAAQAEVFTKGGVTIVTHHSILPELPVVTGPVAGVFTWTYKGDRSTVPVSGRKAAKISARKSGEWGILTYRNSFQPSAGGAPHNSTTAASVPSAEVPDISPTTIIGPPFSGMGVFKSTRPCCFNNGAVQGDSKRHDSRRVPAIIDAIRADRNGDSPLRVHPQRRAGEAGMPKRGWAERMAARLRVRRPERKADPAARHAILGLDAGHVGDGSGMEERET